MSKGTIFSMIMTNQRPIQGNFWVFRKIQVTEFPKIKLNKVQKKSERIEMKVKYYWHNKNDYFKIVKNLKNNRKRSIP